jgi:hypothetical protein
VRERGWWGVVERERVGEGGKGREKRMRGI